MTIFGRIAFAMAAFTCCSWSAAALAQQIIHRALPPVEDASRDYYQPDVRHIDLSAVESPSDVMRTLDRLPNLETLVIAGPRWYLVGQLERFAKIETLHALVLDCTDFSEAAIERVREQRPDLTIHRSQRWGVQRIRSLGREIYIDSRIPDGRASREIRALRQLAGDDVFLEVQQIDMSRLPDLETGPQEPILNEQLMPLKYLRTATRVDLSWCRINDAGMHYLKGFTKLDRLSLRLNEVTADGLRVLSGLTELQEFKGRLNDDNVRAIGQFRNLLVLDTASHHLDSNELTDKGLESIAELSDLERLNLSHTQVRGPGLEHLAQLAWLRHVDLEGSNVEDLKHLPALPRLTSLRLDNTGIDDAQMAHVGECQELRAL
jgi:hypothetical protein